MNETGTPPDTGSGRERDFMSTSFALIGHAGDGKTTLADSLLMAAGVTNRLGSVEDGTSYMNWLPEEKARRLTISASVCSFEREGQLVTAIDSPGDTNFAGEATGALNAVDNAVLVLPARDGVRIGTERAYRLARERGIAVTAVANKMDQELANYDACATQLEEMLGVRVVKLHLPVGAGEDFSGYVDLLSGDLHKYATDGSGKVEVSSPPPDLSEEVATRHMELVEAAAEADDAVLEKYLEEGEIGDEEVVATLRKGLREGSLLPLLSACASRNIGGAALLEASTRFFPTASDVGQTSGARGDEELDLSSDPNGPLAARVFKSVADRYTGVLSLVRVFSGKLSLDSAVSNARTGTRERVTKLLRVSGEHTEEVSEVGPGEIAALPKLKDTKTGDTLCAEKDTLTVRSYPPPAGVISFAVEATTKGDEDKVFESLNRLVEEDPSLKLGRDERTGEFLLTGLGQLHSEVTLEKLKRLFGVDVTLKPPKVPYLETISGRAANVEGKLKKQSGGRGQFGVCYLSVEPGARGSGVDFQDEIVGGSRQLGDGV
jgi:elongation factor G